MYIRSVEESVGLRETDRGVRITRAQNFLGSQWTISENLWTQIDRLTSLFTMMPKSLSDALLLSKIVVRQSHNDATQDRWLLLSRRHIFNLRKTRKTILCRTDSNEMPNQ